MNTKVRPGLRLRTKLMLLGLALLIVPWFGYRQLVEMEAFLVNGQSQAQLLTAEGISTLLNGRADLFNDLPVSMDDYQALYAHPLQQAVRIDGRDNDWTELTEHAVLFGGGDENADAGIDGAMRVLLGERAGQLYASVLITDDTAIFRNPDYLRLDTSDHLRLSFTHHDGQDGRLIITFADPGVTTSYHMDESWGLAAAGQPENRVQGAVQETENGFLIEFRVPLELLGTRQHFGLSYVDVDDLETRAIRHITQTLTTAGSESFNLVVLRSPEVRNIIEGLGYAGARIMVVDGRKRVRAETGAYTTPLTEGTASDTKAVVTEPAEPDLLSLDRWLAFARPVSEWVSRLQQPAREDPSEIGDRVITSSLNANPVALRRTVSGDVQTIMAAHPIIDRDQIIGTVIVEQNTEEILALQRAALEQIVLASGMSLLGVFLLLLMFSVRLAWRIRSLRTETSEAIDQHGRLRKSGIRSETRAGDEIGDLARSISSMLSRLHQHNQFLENMPRTLRHEINNPLNTLLTSLQNMEAEHPEMKDSKYLDSAKRGVLRIGSIIQNLAEAASLEESLESEELELIDINQLLLSYVGNCRLVHPDCEFIYRGSGRPAYANVADYRIEQLLDKIIDNAIDFHRPDSPIKVQLDADRTHLQVTVANRGPILPSELEANPFDSMVSHRSDMSDNRLHFGLGLYVVRVIAEHHGGNASASNLEDGSGVAVSVRLPRVTEQTRAKNVAPVSAAKEPELATAH